MSHLDLITWQTVQAQGKSKNKGYKKAIRDTAIRGENVGHSAVKLVLPINEETMAYVPKMCAAAGVPIPYYVVSHAVSQGNINYSEADIPVISKHAQKIHNKAEYHIYFSFWPGDEKALSDEARRFNLHTPFEDFTSEQSGRTGLGENYRRDLLGSENIKIEEVRNDKGKLKRTFLLSPDIKHGEPSDESADFIQYTKLMTDFQTLRARLINIGYADHVDDNTISERDFIICAEIDALFPELKLVDKFNIQKFQDEDGNYLAKEERDQIVMDLVKAMNPIDKLLFKARSSLEYNEQTYRATKGDQGDDIVSLPVKDETHPDSLDPKKMLTAMAKIIDEGTYKFYKYNCSNAAEAVILEGLPSEKFRKEFMNKLKHRVLPTTPQIARGKTMHIQGQLYEQRMKKQRTGKDQKPQPEGKISESIQIVAADIAKNAKEKEAVIEKTDISPNKKITDIITAADLNKLTKRMRKMRKSEDKIPVLSNELIGDIAKANREAQEMRSSLGSKKQALSKKNQQKLETATRFIQAHTRLENEKRKILRHAKDQLHEVRQIGMKERTNSKFVALMKKHTKGECEFSEVKAFIEQHPRLKKSIIEGKRLSQFAKDNHLKELSKYLSPIKKSKKSKKQKEQTELPKATSSLAHNAEGTPVAKKTTQPIKGIDQSSNRATPFISERSTAFGTLRKRFEEMSSQDQKPDATKDSAPRRPGRT